MILLMHILIALGSIASSSYLFFSPSKTKLFTTYSLVAATLVSGTYLTIATSAHLVQACTTGLVYLGVVSVGIVGAHQKLATAKNLSRKIK